jgi:hypothetical protein
MDGPSVFFVNGGPVTSSVRLMSALSFALANVKHLTSVVPGVEVGVKVVHAA